MRVVVRLLSGRDVPVDVAAATTVAALAALVVEREPAARDKFLRFVFQGRVLQEEETLAGAGIGDGCVVHCAIADHAPTAQQRDPNAAAAGQAGSGRIVPNVGFDRLREAGFTDEDVANFRYQFHGRDGYLPEEATMREREEAWMNNLVSAQHGDVDEYGDGRYRDLLVGVGLGFLGGLLVVFLASDQAFSQRYVVGIFTGMLINLAFGFLRMTYY